MRTPLGRPPGGGAGAPETGDGDFRPAGRVSTSGVSQGLREGRAGRRGCGHGEAAAGPKWPGRRGAGPDRAGSEPAPGARPCRGGRAELGCGAGARRLSGGSGEPSGVRGVSVASAGARGEAPLPPALRGALRPSGPRFAARLPPPESPPGPAPPSPSLARCPAPAVDSEPRLAAR